MIDDLRLIYGLVLRVPHCRRWLALYFGIMVVAVIAEGVSIAMEVPILSSGQELSFDGVPILGEIASYFSQYDFDERMRFVAIGLLGLIVVRAVSEYLSGM
jgi:hypothetical protein